MKLREDLWMRKGSHVHSQTFTLYLGEYVFLSLFTLRLGLLRPEAFEECMHSLYDFKDTTGLQ